MDIKKLNAIIEKVKEDVGDGLLSTDIWNAADGQAIAGYNSNPKATALMNRMIAITNETLTDAKFPLLNRYFIHHLEGDHLAITTFIGNYRWGMMIDLKKTQLGLLLNVVIPEVMEAIKEIVASAGDTKKDHPPEKKALSPAEKKEKEKEEKKAEKEREKAEKEKEKQKKEKEKKAKDKREEEEEEKEPKMTPAW
jgi:flagellar biosynthesis GTPase FlhF